MDGGREGGRERERNGREKRREGGGGREKEEEAWIDGGREDEKWVSPISLPPVVPAAVSATYQQHLS